MIGTSIRYQFAAAIIGIEIVMLALLAYSTLNLLSETYRDRLADSAENIARQYAATAARYIFEKDMTGLSDYSAEVASHEELVSIRVFDRSQDLVFSYFDPALSGAHKDASDGDPSKNGTFFTSAEIDFAGQPLGEARLGFSLTLLEASITAARWRGIAIAVGEVLLTIIVGLWIGDRLTRGLRRLSDAAERYGAGETDVTVPVTSKDEVGRTAAAFNAMISDRKAADAQLRRNEARFRALIENSKDLIIVVSGEGKISYASSSVTQILGVDRKGLIGRGIDAAFGEEAAEAVTRHLIAAQETPAHPVRDELMVRHADGSEVFLEMIAQSYLDNADVAGVVLNCWDVTDRKTVEDQLRQSAKMEAIGNLTGGVAHDFNNLLAVVLGNLELLEREVGSRAAREYVDAALEATRRGADLTKNMLSFARQARLEPVRIDLNDVVRDIKKWSARVLPETIEVETSLLAGLWMVEADTNATQNALLNLMLNARDAMPDGGKLTIETANLRIDEDYIEERDEEIPPGRYVMLAVSDTGTGIPKEDLDRVFDPFFSTKGPGRGSGLGLSMVMGFMRQSGGSVRVYSEAGAGTTFKLFFPSVTAPKRPVQPEIGDRAAATTKGARILIAEDEAGVMKVISEFLTGAGYRVFEAGSGDEALMVFREAGGIDLLLTDIVMPGSLQGPTLARRLREIQPGLPAVFMSGYPNEATVHGNGLRPEDVRLMKPVPRDDLIKAVETALRSAGTPGGGDLQ